MEDDFVAAIALGIDRWTEQKWEQISGIKSEKVENSKPISKKSRPKIVKSRWI